MLFRSEIDTPLDVPARTRFQRYRGLRSFRTSPWDPFENLPRDYARIFQFEDFKRTERAVRRRAEEEGGIEVCIARCSVLSNPVSHCHQAWYSRDGLPEGCPEGSCPGGPRKAICGLQPPAARTQKDRTQLHRSTEHRVRRLCPLKG